MRANLARLQKLAGALALLICTIGVTGVAGAYVGRASARGPLPADTGDTADSGDTGDTADTEDSGDPVDSVYCDECLSVSELAGEKGDCSVAPAGGTGLGLALAALALARRRRAR